MNVMEGEVFIEPVDGCLEQVCKTVLLLCACSAVQVRLYGASGEYVVVMPVYRGAMTEGVRVQLRRLVEQGAAKTVLFFPVGTGVSRDI